MMDRSPLSLGWMLASCGLACGTVDSTVVPAPTERSVSEPSTERALTAPLGAGDEASLTPLQEASALGGQSGTADDQMLLSCPEPRPLDREMDRDGVPLSTRLEQVFGSHSLSGAWLAQGGWVPLELTLRDLGGGTYTAGPPRCELTQIPIEISVAVPGIFNLGPAQMMLGASLPFDESAFASAEQVPSVQVPSGGQLELKVEWPPYGPLAQIVLVIRWGEASAVFVVPPPRPPRHQPDAAVAEDCARAELEEAPLAHAAIVDEAAALEALLGNWAICDFEEQLPYAGIQIRPDRTWSTMVPGDPLRLESGFEGEGSLVFQSPTEGGISEFLALPLGPAWAVPTISVLPSASGDTIRGPMLLVRLTRPIAPAPPPSFARDERAGAAGCASPETGFAPWFSDEASLQAALEGSWTICSGGTGSVRFSGDQVQLPNAAAPQSYYIYRHEGLLPDGHSRTLVFDSESWAISLSAQPRKLFVRRIRDWTMPALEPLVLSAEP